MAPSPSFQQALRRVRKESSYHLWLHLPPIAPKRGWGLTKPTEFFHREWIQYFINTRQLGHLLTYNGMAKLKNETALHWKYTNINDPRTFTRHSAHGTAFPFMKSICERGGLSESIPHDGAMRAANYGRGVYSSPRIIHTAYNKYAIPQALFSNDCFYKLVADLRVNDASPEFKIPVPTGPIEYLAPAGDVQLVGFFVFPNTGAGSKEPRIESWVPECEP